MVSVCDTTIKYIMANFICDNRDPQWINKRTKKLIHKRNSLCRDYRKINDT